MLSFKDIFIQIGGHIPPGLFYRLTGIKSFVCVSVSWFICSLKNLDISPSARSSVKGDGYGIVFEDAFWTTFTMG